MNDDDEGLKSKLDISEGAKLIEGFVAIVVAKSKRWRRVWHTLQRVIVGYIALEEVGRTSWTK